MYNQEQFEMNNSQSFFSLTPNLVIDYSTTSSRKNGERENLPNFNI